MTEIIATIKQGQLKGLADTDLNGEQFYKFLGIPYAKPPVGPLRFKAPQPSESWTEIRDATRQGDPCLARELMGNKIIGSEDCLYLNVFTKELPKRGVTPKPVMVYIHGGGFIVGSSSELFQGPKYLIAENIVLVTINYRLGIFGFLSSDDLSLNIPGNAGLKDQTLALKWVQENIASFNGDPNNVTIFGISAGGASVNFQVLSPAAKGLFHKAIAQSGVAINPWAWGQKNVVLVAEKLGKNVSSDKDALDILMNISAEKLYEASQKISDEIFDYRNRRPFGPVIEKPNPTAFLTENPSDILASGNFNQVPLIQGFTSNEGLIVEFNIPGVPKTNPNIDGVSWSLGLEENSEEYAEIKALIYEHYFRNGETEEAVHELIGDVGMNIGIIEATKSAAKVSRSPVYLYVFSYELPISKSMHKALTKEKKEYKGVMHGGDQLFLFSMPNGFEASSPDPEIRKEFLTGVRKVTKIWADFARTSRPHEQWEPITNINELKYFDINVEPALKLKPLTDRVAFWENIFKEIPTIDAHLDENPKF